MKKYILIILVAFSCCKTGTGKKDVVIKVNIKNFPYQKLYLSSAADYENFLDSASVKNGEFQFNYKPANPFEPFTALLAYKDSSGKMRSLFFYNKYTSTPEQVRSNSGFMLEWGETNVTGDFNAKFNVVQIKAGRENELQSRIGYGSFAYLPDDDPKRAEHIRQYENEIRKNPYSYFLIDGIYNFRDRYTTDEIKQMVSLFEKPVQQSRTGRRLTQYITYLTKPGDNCPNLQLPDAKGNISAIMNADAKLNMLIFWASWCGPCRLEIPALKDVYRQFGEQGLNMTSISIDENPQAWQTALTQEKMPWLQYVMDSANADKYKAQYRITAVPLVVFTDAAGKELLRVDGYDLNEPNPYIPFIAGYLTKAGR